MRGIGVDDPAQAWILTNRKVTSLGEDLLMEADVI